MLIAFVVVAAVFSYVVLGAGFFTTQKSQEVVHTGVQQASSTLEIVGNVYGVTATSGAPTITFVNFSVGLVRAGLRLTSKGRNDLQQCNPTGDSEHIRQDQRIRPGTTTTQRVVR